MSSASFPDRLARTGHRSIPPRLTPTDWWRTVARLRVGGDRVLNCSSRWRRRRRLWDQASGRLWSYAAVIVSGELGSPGRPAAGMWLMACSARAVIVRDGLTPTLAGIAEPSQTSRFS